MDKQISHWRFKQLITWFFTQIKKLPRIWCLSREAYKLTKRNRISQLIEIAHLWLNGISIFEYYYYRLYDNKKFNPKMKKTYWGYRPIKKLYASKINDPRYACLADDKYVFYTHTKLYKLPHPRIYAIFDKNNNFCYLNIKHLYDKEDLHKYFTTECPYPIFLKPRFGGYGKNCLGVASFSQKDNTIKFINGEILSIYDFLRNLDNVSKESPILIQQLLKSNKKIEMLCGHKLTTMRAITLVKDGRVKIFRTVWKIPIGSNMVDNTLNFLEEDTGNLAAKVNPINGEVKTVVQCNEFDLKEISTHPETNKLLKGFFIPHWNSIRKILINASLTIPAIRIQSWDVALSNIGEYILELNFQGGIDIAQLFGPPGIYDSEFREFISKYK